jgi:predicted transcriptional regulator
MQDAPLSAAREALDDAPGSLGIPVVDRHHRLVGRLAHAAAALALLGPPLAGAVSHHARPATGTVHEATPLGEAFRIMASRHARELLVVNSDHEIVGVLRDIDALQALVEARRSSSRPPTA